MSEPKLISPMLDNFVMGDPMSDHHGVRCCPAMEKDSDKKYIVKIISIPASQLQLDALLLAGAYKDSASALEYFKELSDGVIKEAQALQMLSKLEGFIPFESWQVVPMENEVGYDIYLLGTYKRSLQRFFRKHTMTHLGAVNLGLDLCAAMAVCRHAGLLYVDLKPGNIFISEEQEYRIGDLGFVPLDSLKYASLPDKYRSAYTAPEIKDAYSALNPTIDIYAIGLILYQAFNGGILPFEGQAPEDPLPPPQYADYEMAEIILKACAPDPSDRWQDPIQMGQAIVSYMQRNGANDIPIVPMPSAAPAEDSAPSHPETEPEAEPEAEAPEEPIAEQTPPVDNGEIAAEDAEPADSPEEPPEDDAADLSFMDSMVSDETAPDEATALTVEYQELSDETSEILSQADDLIAHETPDPVVPPEPIDVPIPAPIVAEPEEDSSEEAEPEEEISEADTPEEEASEETASVEIPDETVDQNRQKPRKKGSWKRVFGIFIVLLVIVGLLLGGYYFYNEYYLLPVNLQLDGSENQLSVKITAEIDESLLTVVCQDTHGNVATKSVQNGVALFTDLNPNTQYQISLQVSGFHKLTGQISGSYNTPAQTNVAQFDATTGSEDGSVILNFTVDGKEPEQWSIVYSAEGEQEQTVTFSGHMVTIRDLVIGKEYTFRLVSTSPLYIVGKDQVTYTAISLVYAQNLAITSCQDGALTAVWEAPEDSTINSWTVRCYNDAGFDQTIITEETQAVFTDIDTTLGYTVDVTAEGMIMGTHTYISDNSVTVSNIRTDVSDPRQIDIAWDFSGLAPEDGWLLLYTIDGSEQQEVIPCEGSSVTISPMIPDAHYEFILQAANGTTVFNGSSSLDTPAASEYSGYRLTAADFNFVMCLTPEKENWSYTDVSDDAITSTFQAGQRASIIIRVYKTYNYDASPIVTMFLIRDEDGKLVSAATDTNTWVSMWNKSRCCLDIPALPDTPGNYTVTIYFNGAYAGEQAFTVTEAE